MPLSTALLRLYRWTVLLLAAYFIYVYVLNGDYSNFGGPLRKLTNWGLVMSFVATLAMIASMERWTARSHEVTAMVAAVVNLMVLFLYWRLYFEDPALVHEELQRVVGGRITILVSPRRHA